MTEIFPDILQWVVILFLAYRLDRVEKRNISKVNKPVKKNKCNHEKFTMDTQIRTIRCDDCGFESWLNKEHKNLF